MKTKSLLPAALLAALLPSLATAQRADAPRFQRPDPETLAAEMIGDYDADESDSLTEAELAAAFAGVREKRRAEMRALCPNPDGRMAGPGPRGRGIRGGPARFARRGPPEPEFMAALLLKIADENDNGALDAEELLAGLKWTRENMPAKRFGPAPEAE